MHLASGLEPPEGCAGTSPSLGVLLAGSVPSLPSRPPRNKMPTHSVAASVGAGRAAGAADDVMAPVQLLLPPPPLIPAWSPEALPALPPPSPREFTRPPFLASKPRRFVFPAPAPTPSCGPQPLPAGSQTMGNWLDPLKGTVSHQHSRCCALPPPPPQFPSSGAVNEFSQ